MEEPESSDRTIASRPSLEQVSAIVSFMSSHPLLGLGQLRGLEGRDQSRRLWARLTKTLNSLKGPTRPVKSWIKYWADKKSAVRSKVQSCSGDPNTLTSPTERAIWDQFLAHDTPKSRRTRKVKHEQILQEVCFETLDLDVDQQQDQDQDQPDLGLELDYAPDHGDRHTQLMDKLLQAMSRQGEALTQLAQASAAQSLAMERLADAHLTQARAVDRLASTFESIGAHTRDIGGAMGGIHTHIKRFYDHEPT